MTIHLKSLCLKPDYQCIPFATLFHTLALIKQHATHNIYCKLTHTHPSHTHAHDTPLTHNTYNRTSCFEYIKFISEDTKVKQTNITTIYKDN